MLKIDDDNNIYLTRGDTPIIDVSLKDEEGNPYSMTSNERLIFTLRKLWDKGTILLTKTVATPVFTFTTDDTKDLDFGEYVYDIYLYNTNTNNRDTFIAEKIFTIGEEAHEFE